MKRYVALCLVLCLSLLCFYACSGDESDIEAEVKYSVYENEGVDHVSFYLTADTDTDGEWSCSFGEMNTLSILEKNEVERKSAKILGLFELGGNGVKYTTIICKAKAEGEDICTFTLNDGRVCEYLVKVKKDDSGILRITVANR